MSDVLAINVDQPYASLLAHGITNWLTAAEPPPDGVTDAEWLIVSGAVLGVGRVLDVLPIVPHAGCRDGSPHVCIGSYGMLAHSKLHEPWPDGETEHDISDQLPYGDWSPGRWAWRMEVRRLDPPVREYDCPECERWCEVLVSNAVGHDRIDLPKHSPLGGDGRPCPGVLPVRGRQGVWRPDPALVAVVREVLDGN